MWCSFFFLHTWHLQSPFALRVWEMYVDTVLCTYFEFSSTFVHFVGMAKDIFMLQSQRNRFDSTIIGNLYTSATYWNETRSTHASPSATKFFLHSVLLQPVVTVAMLWLMWRFYKAGLQITVFVECEGTTSLLITNAMDSVSWNRNSRNCLLKTALTFNKACMTWVNVLNVIWRVANAQH